MKTLVGLLLLTGSAIAQSPTQMIRRDSLALVLLPTGDLPVPMPTVRPDNSFYRTPANSQNLLRATLDNMPVKTPDSSTHYTMLQSYPQLPKLNEQAAPLVKPTPRTGPKKFK
ncbi:hypothetical protein [Spirosoma sp. KNUC1025]|uniref:hypothetical protein n=1 Tax=Spirosoma sp. KNUC1025 TaxID=2894082 RepID=UPI00386DF75A|nr:hypothetical protein LN737_21215 [Spirosoma sp. KNUC1025]